MKLQAVLEILKGLSPNSKIGPETQKLAIQIMEDHIKEFEKNKELEG